MILPYNDFFNQSLEQYASAPEKETSDCASSDIRRCFRLGLKYGGTAVSMRKRYPSSDQIF